MEHKGTVTLETGRLVLRRFTLADAEAMYENWASEEAVTEYLTWPAHGSVDATRAVLADWVKGYESTDFYQWAIELKQLGQVIGSISVTAQNPAVSGCELGWCIGSRWWGQGIMPEAGGIVSLDKPSEDSDMNYYDVIPADNDVFEKIETRDAVLSAVKELSETERQLVKFRFSEELSQVETARRMGVSQMYVSRMERKILEKLRERLKKSMA